MRFRTYIANWRLRTLFYAWALVYFFDSEIIKSCWTDQSGRGFANERSSHAANIAYRHSHQVCGDIKFPDSRRRTMLAFPRCDKRTFLELVRRSEEIYIASVHVMPIECIDDDVISVHLHCTRARNRARHHTFDGAPNGLMQRSDHLGRSRMCIHESFSGWLSSQVMQCMHKQLFSHALLNVGEVVVERYYSTDDSVVTFPQSMRICACISSAIDRAIICHIFCN